MRSRTSVELLRNVLGRLGGSLATAEGVWASCSSGRSLKYACGCEVAGVKASECVLLVEGCLFALLLLDSTPVEV